MYQTTAYFILDKMDKAEPISEARYYELIRYFRESILCELDFTDKLGKHRKPVEFLSQVRQDLWNVIRDIQRRPEMSDIDGNRHGYVPSVIKWLWEEDKTFKSSYQTIKEYCRRRSVDFATISVHVAEYRAVNKLASRISRMINARN